MNLPGGIILVILFLFSFFENEKVVRMNQSSFSSEITQTDSIYIDFKDTIPNKILIVYKDEHGDPVKYSRDIITGVCIDGECRMVRISLFWNNTGRYLGFELPKGEYLSKTEHNPFKAEEYDLLHKLMGEKNSALATYTIDELVPLKNSSSPKVDAVSSATIAAVLDYIVEGAVYTTYALWHIAYGPTKFEIEKLTSDKLNSDFVLRILDSEKLEDRIWVLNHMDSNMEVSSKLQQKLLKLISGNDIYLAERSLNAIKSESLNEDFQIELMDIFASSGFLQKRLILQKFNNVPRLNSNVIDHLSNDIHNLNGTLVKNTLELFKVHQVNDKMVVLRVSNLLKNKNRYISNQAFSYLEGLNIQDKKTLKNINKYRKRN